MSHPVNGQKGHISHQALKHRYDFFDRYDSYDFSDFYDFFDSLA